MKNKILNIAVIIISLVIFLYFLFYKNGLSQLISVFKVINHLYLLVAIALMFIYWAFEVFIIHELTRLLYPTHKFRKSIKAAMVGQLFASITPLQTGAQPAIFYILTEEGIDSGTASSILMMKFIVHQTTMTIYSFIIIILKFSYFKSMIPGLFYLCIVGFVVNSGIIIIAVMFSINKNFTKNLLLGIYKLFSRINLIKNLKKSESKLKKSLIGFYENAELIAKNYKVIIKVAAINTAQLTVFYAIPYVIYRSFNLESASLWNMLAAQTLVMTIVSITPLPGGAGGAEGGFTLLFSAFFKGKIIPAVILWRIITYYSCIFVGALFSIHLPKGKDKDSLRQKE